MQKKKLSIDNLKIKSFVTITDKEVKAGRLKETVLTLEPTPATHCFDCSVTVIN